MSRSLSPRAAASTTARAVAVIVLTAFSAMAAPGCAPDDDVLCERYLSLMLKPEQADTKLAKEQCLKTIESKRDDAGRLRWGGVARCVEKAETRDELKACWIGAKPKDD